MNCSEDVHSSWVYVVYRDRTLTVPIRIGCFFAHINRIDGGIVGIVSPDCIPVLQLLDCWIGVLYLWAKLGWWCCCCCQCWCWSLCPRTLSLLQSPQRSPRRCRHSRPVSGLCRCHWEVTSVDSPTQVGERGTSSVAFVVDGLNQWLCLFQVSLWGLLGVHGLTDPVE